MTSDELTKLAGEGKQVQFTRIPSTAFALLVTLHSHFSCSFLRPATLSDQGHKLAGVEAAW